MKTYRLVQVPATVLRQKAEPITNIDGALVDQIKAMFHIMSANYGVGLASNQVGVLKRVFVMSALNAVGWPKKTVCINPEIIASSEKKFRMMVEECLSIPNGIRWRPRSPWVRLRYTDIDGKTVECTMRGINSVVAQHEIDHLNGTLMLDRD